MLLAVDAAFSVRGEAPLLPALVPAPRVMALSEGTCPGGMKPKVERDAALPAEGYEYYSKKGQLLPSGLKGPVSLRIERN